MATVYSDKTMKNQSVPVCSICIANYNGIGVIHECIAAIKAQDCPFPIEIIIHDDASKDGSVEYIRRHFSDAILIASKENVGFCISNNKMVARANGKYVLILNNDAILLPDALSVLYTYAESKKEMAILGLRQYDAKTGALIDFGILLDLFLNSVPNKDLNRTEVAMMMGSCLWLPKALWERIGGFPEWFHTMHEDMYVCCMARLYGYPVEMIQQSGYRHWVGKSLGGGKIVQKRLSTTATRRALSERNRIFVIVLCYPDPWLPLVLPAHLFLLLFEGIILSTLKKDMKILKTIYFPAIKSFWKNRHMLFVLRRSIQSEKQISNKQFFSVVNAVPHKLRMLVKYGIPEIS